MLAQVARERDKRGGHLPPAFDAPGALAGHGLWADISNCIDLLTGLYTVPLVLGSLASAALELELNPAALFFYA